MFSRITSIVVPVLLLSFTAIGSLYGADEPEEKAKTLQSVFPGLSSGPLHEAEFAELPEGVLLMSGDIRVTADEVAAEIEGAPDEVRAQISKYRFFVLENKAIREFLLKEARVWASESGADAGSEGELINGYLQHIASRVEVTDEEVEKFYKENTAMFGGAELDQIKPALKTHLANEKQGEAVSKHLDSIGKRHSVRVSEAWAGEQYMTWLQNPVEQARLSGKPSMVNFGSDNCAPCQMMAPARDEIKEAHKDTLNVVYIHVNEEQILARNYRVSSIPVLVFYDKEGKEAHRSVGFIDKQSMEAYLADIGIK